MSENDQDIEDEEIGSDEEGVSAVDDTAEPVPEQIESEPEPEPELVECPPCKKGSPAWMATFADMATLLMAFFVLILSFAHVNVPKYKEVSGSMRSRFGVQVLVPIVEAPSLTIWSPPNTGRWLRTLLPQMYLKNSAVEKSSQRMS